MEVKKKAAPPSAPDKKQKKIINKVISYLISPVVLGLFITGGFFYFSYVFFELTNDFDKTSTKRAIFDLVEWIDQKTLDVRFINRGPRPSESKIAVLSIDEKSLDEIGRWPWSREKVAFMVDRLMQHGAKVLGFDIVFSEPQIESSYDTLLQVEGKLKDASPDLVQFLNQEKERSQPDKRFAEVIKKYRDKLVLGAYSEDTIARNHPAQDLCFHEAFKRTDAFQMIESQELPVFVVDSADKFASVSFEAPLKTVFDDIQKKTTEKMLKERFRKATLEELNRQEQAQLKASLNVEYMTYCYSWMIEGSDSYLATSKAVYKDLFKDFPDVAALDFGQAIDQLFLYSFRNPLLQKRLITVNVDTLRKETAHTALFDAEIDTDGTIRKSPLVYRAGFHYTPSLALQTFLVAHGLQAHVFLGIDPDNYNQKIVTELKIVNPETDASYSVPVDSRGRLKINYAGPQKMFPYLRASDLFHDGPTAEIEQRVWNEKDKEYQVARFTVNKDEFIKDRIFIVGATAMGVYDMRATPFEKIYPGVETHINVVDNLMTKNFLRTHPSEEKYMLAAVAILGILFSLLLNHVGALVGILATIFAVMCLYTVDRLVLFKHGIVATTAIPMGLILFLYTFMTFYKYLTEERKKKHLRSTFSKYVSPAIVDEILSDPDNVELGGRKQRMSVFFSDVRGFTTISEKLDPQVLSKVLNDYLTPMTEIVFANKGTLDKYMGDAVMAFFGAPIFFEDHAKYACRCALQSIVKLKQLQEEFKAKGLPNIDIGIGLNTAEMSVGNMGSDIVRSYTVMGDAVNLGSRLEGINKEYGTRIIISEFTYNDVKNAFTTREIDWVRVKGKNQPIRIYELIGEGPPQAETKQLIELFSAGFAFYHEKKFKEALEQFNAALNVRPDDPVSTLYVERCQDYLGEPPPENWDGVFVMKTK